MNLPRRLLAPAAAVALTLAASACSGADDEAATAGTSPTPAPATAPAPAEAEVAIDTFIFTPDPITVAAGTTVTFTNGDATTHTVTAGTREAPQLEVIDASLDQGDSTTWTLAEPGTYDYYCRLHSGPGMTGQIVVE